MQLALRLRAHHHDPQTSRDAAASMRDGAAHHRHAILHAMRGKAPMTYVEIATIAHLNPIATARRMSELLRMGSVQRLPQTRLTPSARPAHLWEAL